MKINNFFTIYLASGFTLKSDDFNYLERTLGVELAEVCGLNAINVYTNSKRVVNAFIALVGDKNVLEWSGMELQEADIC